MNLTDHELADLIQARAEQIEDRAGLYAEILVRAAMVLRGKSQDEIFRSRPTLKTPKEPK